MKTSSFRTYTGPGRVSIARFAPRGHPAGYRVYSRLAPGEWFNKVSIEEYCRLYGEILDRLDPKQTYAELVALAAPEEPVLLCYEVPPFSAPQVIPAAGLGPEQVGRSNWCHRRIVAVWFKQTIGVNVDELELPGQGGVPKGVPKGPPTHVRPTGAEPAVPVVPTSWLNRRK